MLYEMKLQYNVNSVQQRELRKQEVKCRDAQRQANARGVSNYPTWGERRLFTYNMRLEVRQCQRYLHLARAIIRGQAYKEVEQGTREGNGPDTDALLDTLNAWGFNPDVEYVANWLGE